MQTIESIQKILVDRKLTQAALADLLGLERTQINNYLSGKREPGPLPCLILAALAITPAEQVYWVTKSGVTNTQLKLLSQAIGSPSPTLETGDEAQLIAWWRSPSSPTEGYVRDLVEKVLALRTK